jgi:hypothetical protein
MAVSAEQAFVAQLTATPRFASESETQSLGISLTAAWATVKVIGKGAVAVLFKDEGLKHVGEAIAQIIVARKSAELKMNISCPRGKSILTIEGKQTNLDIERMMKTFLTMCSGRPT